MTYNFDVDAWYDMHRTRLERLHGDGTLDDAAFEKACVDLDRRYEDLWRRLDGSYQLPKTQ